MAVAESPAAGQSPGQNRKHLLDTPTTPLPASPTVDPLLHPLLMIETNNTFIPTLPLLSPTLSPLRELYINWPVTSPELVGLGLRPSHSPLAVLVQQKSPAGLLQALPQL